MKRQDLNLHISSHCPLTVIDCEFSYAGCEVKLARQDMAAHLTENIVNHLYLQAANQKAVVDRLEEENKWLKEQVAKLTKDLHALQIHVYTRTPICPVEFIMTNFEQHKRNEDEWWSPSFHTHPKGYKMCITVRANGYSYFSNTCTSVVVRLMKGEFDDQLTWPLKCIIAIRLLSQVDVDYMELGTNFAHTFDKITEEVTEMARSRETWNFAHIALEAKYLRDNCIKLRVHNFIQRQ